MKYGTELVKELKEEIARMRHSIEERNERIFNCEVDYDDCFISIRCEQRGIRNNQDKIDLIENGGTAWFREYTTLDGKLVNARWCNTKYGSSLRAEMPDGSVVWTTALTQKGLAKKGLKAVECRRPAWFKFKGGSGMYGVYTGNYVLFPSDVNYATGEKASDEPLEIREVA